MTSQLDSTDLSGKVAVVTGAAAGLGRAEAIGLAQAGATVVVNDMAGALDKSDVLAEIEAAGSKGVAVAGDISARSTADELVATADSLLRPGSALGAAAAGRARRAGTCAQRAVPAAVPAERSGSAAAALAVLRAAGSGDSAVRDQQPAGARPRGPAAG